MAKKESFIEIFGDTIHNKILESLLEMRDIDFGICDMAKDLNISKPTAYGIIKKFEKKGYVKKTRFVGNTQLYMVNSKNWRINLLIKQFDAYIKLLILDGR